MRGAQTYHGTVCKTRPGLSFSPRPGRILQAHSPPGGSLPSRLGLTSDPARREVLQLEVAHGRSRGSSHSRSPVGAQSEAAAHAPPARVSGEEVGDWSAPQDLPQALSLSREADQPPRSPLQAPAAAASTPPADLKGAAPRRSRTLGPVRAAFPQGPLLHRPRWATSHPPRLEAKRPALPCSHFPRDTARDVRDSFAKFIRGGKGGFIPSLEQRDHKHQEVIGSFKTVLEDL